jgi:hypothetical protein
MKGSSRRGEARHCLKRRKSFKLGGRPLGSE